jgi:FkbM family methyltransferase
VNDRIRRLVILLLPPIITNAIRAVLGSVRRAGVQQASPPAATSPPVDALPPADTLPPADALPRVAVLPPDPPPTPPARQYWGLYDLDRQIEKYLDFDSGYFVELGANDGKLASNTFYYERSRNWRGVLIEPAPNLFMRCRDSRSAENHIVCAACVSFDYKDEFVKLLYSNSMSVSLNVETDIGDPAAHAELGRQFLTPDETVFAFGAIACTLNSILLEAKAPSRIDFFSLDVEGAEIEVLKGVDHTAFRFRYMLIECRDIARLSDYLEPLGYRLIEKFNEHDYMFSDQSVAP